MRKPPISKHKQHAHWNVKGTEFFALHQPIDTIAGPCEKQSDLIAERVTALGGVVERIVKLVASNSSVPDYDLSAIVGEQHIRAVAKGPAEFLSTGAGGHLAEKLGVKATTDLLTKIVRRTDKDLWFVEAHLMSQPCGGGSILDIGGTRQA